MARRVLILGGTGFVGSEICRRAEAAGWECVLLSRRGGSGGAAKQIHVAGDATQPGVVEAVVKEHGPFSAVIHCIGALLDGSSGLRYANLVVSASRSLPMAGQSYVDITENTALALLRASGGSGGTLIPFVFVSAAEAGWADEDAMMWGGATIERWSPRWLKRYLSSKRAVEAALLNSTGVRPVILRPSFVWNWCKLDVLPLVALFTLLNALGVPFIDRPVRVETIAAAAVTAIDSSSEACGVLRHIEMNQLADSSCVKAAKAP
jgi:nucleoside-diphosphate-sugar epimerase